jgi:hypothetical protein
MPGPPPKREEERRRRNKDGVEIEKVNLDELISQEVEIPVADENWEPLTKSYWDSFKHSGQSIWYEPSDWMTAYTLMEILDRWLKPQDVKVGQSGSAGAENGGGDVDYIFEAKIVAMPGGVLSSILKGLTALMATEGDRRRLRIELERKSAIDAALANAGNVVSIAKTREEALATARRAVDEQTG